jgi:GT2 family glycosyltransferase
MSRASVGAVPIGRNEGERLRRCLEGLAGRVGAVVYVDSGSSDGSVDVARSLGFDAVELDMSIPFSAGRARNAGFEHLMEQHADLEFVQFVDGDCELSEGWLERGLEALQHDPELAIVCGRRREIHPEASIYNRLCDLEWDSPAGETRACGGDFLARTAAFAEVGGFDSTFVAGEEPELCLRLRKRGWRIHRLGAEMTLHDADMTDVSQWWRRAQRSGHAYAQTSWIHRSASGSQGVLPLRSIALWAIGIPFLALGGAIATDGWSLLLFAAFPLQVIRVARAQRRRGRGSRDAWSYATSVVAGKFAQASGVARFLFDRLRGRRATLIEYKRPKHSN